MSEFLQGEDKICYDCMRDKESNYNLGKELMLSEKALKEFVYALYEVEFSVEVDMSTGKSKIIAVDEHKVLYDKE
jgi:hypothetical protein